jgi:hypothetical protein
MQENMCENESRNVVLEVEGKRTYVDYYFKGGREQGLNITMPGR